MKNFFVAFLAITISNTASAGYLQENYVCTSDDGLYSMVISTNNNPGFDLAKYNSEDLSEENEAQLSVQYVGSSSEINATVKVVSVKQGLSQAVVETNDEGQKCYIGTKESGIQLSVNMSIVAAGLVEREGVAFSCTNELYIPTAAVVCE